MCWKNMWNKKKEFGIKTLKEFKTRRKELEIKYQNKFPNLFGVNLDGTSINLKIYKAEENKIQYIEKIHAINDIENILEVHLKDEEWLEQELSNQEKDYNNFNNWINDNSFVDREMINERYGFKNGK